MPQAALEGLTRSVGAALRARGWRVGAAESCTAGLLLKLLTDIAGSSDYVAGGVVAYDDGVKERVLGIPGEVIRAHGAVSEPVAEAMARGVREVLGTEVGVGITGIAGPGGGSAEKPVGTVWFGISTPDGTETERVLFQGDRARIRTGAAQHALSLVLRSVEG